jgi:peptide chain release factor subunit 3
VLRRAEQGVCDWYGGPSLIAYLDGLPSWERALSGPFRMAVSEKGRDMGTLVSGKIESGTVARGQALLLMPNRWSVDVAGVYFEEAEMARGCSGQIVRLKLRGIEEEDVSVGFVLCSPDRPIHAVSRFHARIHLLDAKNIIAPGYAAVLHVHTLAEEVVLAKFLWQLDPKSGAKTVSSPPLTHSFCVSSTR